MQTGHPVGHNACARYRELSEGAGVALFQIGSGIAGDFPICVVPSIRHDLGHHAKPWATFCPIRDATTSSGSTSGATPHEKITSDKEPHGPSNGRSAPRALDTTGTPDP